jgi:hypothetical protein
MNRVKRQWTVKAGFAHLPELHPHSSQLKAADPRHRRASYLPENGYQSLYEIGVRCAGDLPAIAFSAEQLNVRHIIQASSCEGNHMIVMIFRPGTHKCGEIRIASHTSSAVAKEDRPLHPRRRRYPL